MDGNAAPIAGPSNSSSSPPLQRSPPISSEALSPRRSSRNAVYDPCTNATGSPPTTPPRNRRNKKPREKRKQPLRPYASAENGFDKRHSHGLSWSSTTRDSVVDNLLFSLDNLSKKDVSGNDDIPDLEFDKLKYRFPGDAPPLPLINNRTARRARGHTQSSSLSMDYEISPMAGSPPRPRVSVSTRARRSVSSSNGNINHPVNGRMHASKNSVGSVASVETQVPAAKDISTNRTSAGVDGNETSRTDVLYPSFADKSKSGWKRRSMSMNEIFADTVVSPGSILDRGRPVPSVYSKYDAGYFPQDVAPEPTIAGGPRGRDNPTATGPVYVNQATQRSTLRKITTHTDLRSANAQGQLSPMIPQDVRNQATNFVRMNGMQSRPDTQNQGKAQTVSMLQTSAGKNTAAGAAPHAQKERPGFFRRVFGGGSSRANTVRTAPPQAPEHIDPATLTLAAQGTTPNSSQTRTGTGSSSREGESSYPTVSLNKKPSSLFRRRKKSVQDIPPLPPPSLMAPFKVATVDPSPVGDSLWKALDPYISNDAKATEPLVSEQSLEAPRPTTQESSTEDSDNPDIFHSGYTQRPDASLGSRDVASRSSSMKPKQSLENDSNVKMKVKKRTPGALSPTNTSFFLESSSREQSGILATEPEEVSSSSNQAPDNDATPRPNSYASTANRVRPSSNGPLEPDRISRKTSVRSTVSSEKPDHSYIRPSTQERMDSKKPDRLVLKPSVEQILLGNPEFQSVPESQWQTSSVQSPAFYTATSAAFSSGMHSPISPSSQYHSASSLPLPGVQPEEVEPVLSPDLVDDGAEYRERARKIFEGDEEDVTKAEAAAWLGEKNTLSTRTLEAYLQLFEFTGMHILAALRLLCEKLTLRGETQQFDRIITALSARWCECNSSHGFKAQDVVHTICYSLILLNTDLHLAQLGERMSRSAYVKNTLPTIRRVVADAAPNAFDDAGKGVPFPSRPTLPWSQSSGSVPQTPVTPNSQGTGRQSLDEGRPGAPKPTGVRPPLSRQESDGLDSTTSAGSNALVNQPWSGNLRGWEMEIENVLKSFFVAIKNDPLPLHGGRSHSEAPAVDRNGSAPNLNGLRRSNSVISRTPSDNASFLSKPGLRSMTLGFQNKYNRSRPKLYAASTLSSSKTSFDDGNSVWSPTQSTFSKYSLSKTLTSASVQSLGQHFSPSDFKHSIGFANALSQAIIREENAGLEPDSVSLAVPGGLLDDEALTLEGAPWAKEGMVKHKHHLETPGRKAKERNWMDCFAVISKGKLTLFAFNTSTKAASMGRKALTKHQAGGRAASATAPKVGGGDWMENAEQLDVFVLRQTIASTLPPPGYSKTRPHVWALSLPTGAVHLFQVGTTEIAQEFMSTANYWSARLSKEPLSGGVSNVEYGWSDSVINPALVERPFSPQMSTPPVSLQNRQVSHKHSTSVGSGPRPSVTSSLRTSLDTGFGSRPRLPGDKVHLADWQPPSQSMMASQLMEVDQLKALTAYVGHVEAELEKHNELKSAIELAFTPRHTNYNRAMANWQRKSEHLLRENVKFQTYVDSLTVAQKARGKFYERKNQLETTNDDADTHVDAEKQEPGLADVSVWQ